MFVIIGSTTADLLVTSEQAFGPTGADGFLWWHLDDDAWVRSDVVEAKGGCAGVPVVESP